MTDVRRANLDDLPAIAALDRACFVRPWTPEAWRDEILAGAVYVSGSPILALACATVVTDFCELRRIGVDASARGAGQGRSLLAHVIESARVAGCTHVELEVGATNTAALALYRRCGFELVGRRPGYYRAPPDDALSMNLDLTKKSK